MLFENRFYFKRTYIISLIACLMLAGSCTQNQECTTYNTEQWTLVYKNSYDGESLFGSKDDLIYALRSGSPLRIGFGGHREGNTSRSIEHIADAEFISIANNNEVFAQIATIIGQDPSLNEEPLTMAFHEDRKFSMIACTNGTTSNLTIDFKIDTLKTTQTIRRGFYWYVHRANLNRDEDNSAELVEPLWNNPRERK